jgi:DNA-binding CsgD family transcriptional regulator
MIITDGDDRIVSWSAAAQELLGFAPAQVMSQRLFEALDARDAFGNRFCGRGCGFHEMVRAGEPVNTFEMQVCCADGGRLHTFVSVAPEGGRRRGGRLTYHLRADLRRQGDRRRIDDRRRRRPLGRESDDQTTPGDPSWGLSARESQVLRCLAGGDDTAEIAKQLGISETTVRNHVQHVLRKLGVHGRLEAVALAHRYRIV